MNRRAYILNGNYQMLDNLFAEKVALEKQVLELTKQLNAAKSAIARLKQYNK